MEFLSIDDVRISEGELRESFEALMSTPGLVGRPDALQWQLLRACFETLFVELDAAGGDQLPDELSEHKVDRLRDAPDRKLAQYKFETADKLRRYYVQPGGDVDFVFTLLHRRDLEGRVPEVDDYPSFRDYALVVRRLEVGDEHLDRRDLSDYLERVVTDAVDAEMQAYRALPEVRQELLGEHFVPDGPAYRQILNYLERLSDRRWVISEPEYNPSTNRILSIDVRAVDGDEAEVRTREYVYLRWWDTVRGTYAYPYRERNRQTYLLSKTEDGWKVLDNIYPAPKTSAPHRRAD